VTNNVSFWKIESPRFRTLLKYLNPRCEQLLPSHQIISGKIGKIYDKQLSTITEALGAVATMINSPFDLWTSKNRLALLKLVVHFIDSAGRSKSILLALLRQNGRYTGSNIANIVTEVICHYGLDKRVLEYKPLNAARECGVTFFSTGYEPRLCAPRPTTIIPSRTARRTVVQHTILTTTANSDEIHVSTQPLSTHGTANQTAWRLIW
jgi:hypothetical protein